MVTACTDLLEEAVKPSAVDQDILACAVKGLMSETVVQRSARDAPDKQPNSRAWKGRRIMVSRVERERSISGSGDTGVRRR
jgi:hypothetical protein